MSEQTASHAAHTSRSYARQPAWHQIMGLSAQFLLGMAVNLIGLPSQTTGTAHTASNILLGLHILLAAALVANAVMVIRAARNGSGQRQLARWAAALITLTFVAGVLTLITKSNWWSYAMATGFITSLGLYVALLVQSASPERHEQPGA